MKQKTSYWAARVSFIGFAVLAQAACGAGPSDDSADSAVAGSIDLALLTEGLHFDSASYTISSRKPGYSQSGNLDVSNSTRIAALIGGIPSGVYRIDLSATASGHPELSCTGWSDFSVLPRETSAVDVTVYCQATASTGSVAVNGSVVRCPTVTGISADPAETAVGHAMTLSALTSDERPMPGFGYHWDVSGGELSDPESAVTRITCTRPGPIELIVQVTSGDGRCDEFARGTVYCAGSSEDDAATSGDDRVGYIACATQTCAPGSGCCWADGICAASNQTCSSPFAFQSCDGPEDCATAGTVCTVRPHSISCDTPSAYFDIFCHHDEDCSQAAGPNPCLEGKCQVPFD